MPAAAPLHHQYDTILQTVQVSPQSRDRFSDHHHTDDRDNSANHHPTDLNESTRLLGPTSSSWTPSTTATAKSKTGDANQIPDVAPWHVRQKQQQHNASSKVSHPTVFPARISAIVLWFLGGLCMFVLVAIHVVHYHGEASWMTTPGRTGSESRSEDGSETPHVAFFDYIVVGAGPAGIITAVTLARLLPNQTILLVEAGTTSQASVLSRVQEHALKQRRNQQQPPSKQQQPRQTPSQTKETVGTTCSSSVPTTTTATTAASTSLNEFDVPLLWSGVAASTGGALRSTESVVLDSGLLSHSSRHQPRLPLPPQPIHDHHWPIGRTLLGKNIGGSGIQNAMIYIRSLSSEWNQWNISGWDYDRDILPAYQELERYHHGTADDTELLHHATTTTSDGRGQTGPITTTPVDMNLVDAVAPLFVESAIQAGIPSRVVAGFNAVDGKDDDDFHRRGGVTESVDILDANSDDNSKTRQQTKHHPRVGVGYYEFNIRHGVRDSAARAFMGDSSSAPLPDNLWIESGVTVTRVLFEDDESTPHGIISEPDSSGTQNRQRPVQQKADWKGERPPTPLQTKTPRVTGVEYVRTVFTDVVASDAKRNRVGQFLLRRRDSVDDSAPHRCEVILAAGAIMTPQLLVNSGIGDSDDASAPQSGVPQSIPYATTFTTFKVHLPGVGKNLQDHPVVTMGFEIDAELALMGGVSSIYTIGSEMDEYFWAAMELNNLNQSLYTEPAESSTIADLTLQLGTLGTPGFSAGCFLRSPFAADNDTAPDIQITVFPRHMEPHVTRQTQQGKRDYLRLLRNKAMLVTVALLKPEARFEVKASRSSIPLVAWDDQVCSDESDETIKRVRGYRLPAIDLPNGVKRYLTVRDIQRLAWGLEEVRRIHSKAPLANHIGPEMYPGANVRGKELWDYIRSKSLPNAHWAGTTRMSSDTNDVRAVVDERLRVRYVDGLRIVDAGVLPAVPNGNLHSTVCVIAHRAASMIAHDRLKMENHT